MRRLGTEAFVVETRDWALSLPKGSRKVLAIAGAPGSGKSTLTGAILEAVEAQSQGTAAVLPMDGFHYDDEVLVPRGLQPRKGAPHTFDVGGFASLLARLRANEEDEIAVPRFDRDLEIARAGARLVPRSVRLIVAEGNYLLLDQAPWAALRPSFDRTAFVEVSMEELTRRLSARWEGYGLSGAVLAEKMEGNDLPNARMVIEGSAAADVTVLP